MRLRAAELCLYQVKPKSTHATYEVLDGLWAETRRRREHAVQVLRDPSVRDGRRVAAGGDGQVGQQDIGL